VASKAIVKSNETVKKFQHDSYTQDEFQATWRRIVEISVERAPSDEGAHLFMASEAPRGGTGTTSVGFRASESSPKDGE
jgi:hypothetical protein